MDEKVYSPSQTATWMRCAMLRALQKEGWMPREAGYPTLAAVLGAAYAAGVGTYRNIRKSTGLMPPLGVNPDRQKWADISVKTAETLMHAKLAEMEKIGLQFGNMSQDDLQRLNARLQKAVTAHVIQDPIPADWTIEGVEVELEEAGRARADLVCRTPNGLVVVDDKLKVQLKAIYHDKTVQGYANSAAMFHYGYYLSKRYNEDFVSYYIALAVLEPRWGVEMIAYPYNREMLDQWHITTKQAWHQMDKEERGEAIPWMAATHSDNFGQCPMYKACFVHHYDPALMAKDYILVELS